MTHKTDFLSIFNGVLAVCSWSYSASERRVGSLVKLISNIETGLKMNGLSAKVKRGRSGLFIETDSVGDALNVIRRIFGISLIYPYVKVELSRMQEAIGMVSRALPKHEVQYTVNSKQIDRMEHQGELAVTGTGKIKISHVATYEGDAYVFVGPLRGVGGIPLGMSSRVVALVSGGIDSPVATWMAMRKGCPVTVLFAYFPMGGDESDLKRFLEVVKKIREWHIGEDMHVYIYRHDQNLLVFRRAAPRFTCILCRRMMYRVAEQLAKRVEGKAIVTGENLAQVASQTLQNLSVIDQASELPVLRPLIGFDKEETVRIAKRIGTYDASCMKISSGCAPVKGCWARPPKPATHAKLATILEIESKLDIEGLLVKSVESLKEVPKDMLTS